MTRPGRRVVAVIFVMLLALAATLVAAAEAAPGWSLPVLIGGALVQWALYRRWGKPALDALVREMDASDAADPDDPASRRFHDLIPYGSMASRGAWTSRHPWLAGIYWTLTFGLFLTPILLFMEPTVRSVFAVGYLVVSPVMWRLMLARQEYNEAIHRPPR